jgi:hypothetical protein
MTCVVCGYRNDVGERLCGQCGAELERLLRICPNGHETYDSVDFCGQCGGPLRTIRTPRELHQGANDRRLNGPGGSPRRHPGEEAIKERLNSQRRKRFAIGLTIVVVIGLGIGVLRVQERQSLMAQQEEIRQELLLLPPPVHSLSAITAPDVSVFAIGPSRQWALINVRPRNEHPLTFYAHYVDGIWQFIKGQGSYGQRCPTTVIPSSICEKFKG